MKAVTKSMGFVACSVLGSVIFSAVAAKASMVSPIISPVYGSDDRQDLYQVTDPMMLRLADSTVALVESDAFLSDETGSTYFALSSSLSDSHNVCLSEPFAAQKTLAFCSGSLVGPDLVLTAGHCITSMDDCTGAKVVFGFSIRSAGASPDSFAGSEVYQCKNIVARAEDEGGADFAVIQLDRAVVGHTPLQIARTSTLEVGTSLAVIGHPSGLPAKVAGGAFVRDNSDKFKFVANLDTYHGNSGSPVFNVRTGLIEGILVEGDEDYELNAASSCYVNKHCDDRGCKGERSTRISFAAPFIPGKDLSVAVDAPKPQAPVIVVAPAPRPPVVAPQTRLRRRRSLFRRIFGN